MDHDALPTLLVGVHCSCKPTESGLLVSHQQNHQGWSMWFSAYKVRLEANGHLMITIQQ